MSKTDYYNTSGNLVKRFIEGIICLPPIATVNYVIEKEDDSLSGTRANFIIELNAKSSKLKPIVQFVMIGQYSNKAFSFASDGRSIQ